MGNEDTYLCVFEAIKVGRMGQPYPTGNLLDDAERLPKTRASSKATTASLFLAASVVGASRQDRSPDYAMEHKSHTSASATVFTWP